jgi:hypothetical protein
MSICFVLHLDKSYLHHRLRKDSRSALLASKQTIDARSSSNRDELLQSSVIQEHVATTTAYVVSLCVERVVLTHRTATMPS